MNNEKIVQVIVKGDDVLGLTASGHLAWFDKNLNCFVAKGKCEVLDHNSEIVKSAVYLDEKPIQRSQPGQITVQPVSTNDLWPSIGIAIVITAIICALIFRVFF